MSDASKKPQVLWTEAEDAYLTKAWAAGESARTIAAAIGRTRNSVIGRVNRQGLTARVRGSAHVPPTMIKHTKPIKPVLWKFEKAPAKVKVPKAAPSGQYRPAVVVAFKTPAQIMPPKSKDAVEPLMIDIMDLRHKFHCSFPVDGESETMYCGHKTGGHSYCPYHRSIMYMPPIPKTRKRYA